MQPCNYAVMTTQLCGHATMFQMFQQNKLFLERSNFLSEHPSSIFFSLLSNVPKQKAPLIIIK
jgi:hypothetical protein